jgi:hypothetical protein
MAVTRASWLDHEPFTSLATRGPPPGTPMIQNSLFWIHTVYSLSHHGEGQNVERATVTDTRCGSPVDLNRAIVQTVFYIVGDDSENAVGSYFCSS